MLVRPAPSCQYKHLCSRVMLHLGAHLLWNVVPALIKHVSFHGVDAEMYGVTVAGGVTVGSEVAGCAGRGCILGAQASLRGPGDDPVACLQGDDYQSLMQVSSVRSHLGVQLGRGRPGMRGESAHPRGPAWGVTPLTASLLLRSLKRSYFWTRRTSLSRWRIWKELQ